MQDALNQLSPKLKGVFSQLVDDHKRALIEIRMLREQLRLRRIEKFGRRSEKLTDEQLELLEGEPSVAPAEVEQEANQAEEAPAKPRRKKRKAHPGRVELPAHLERREVKIPCSPQDCICPHCQGEKKIIGYDRSEELDVIPAQHFVTVTLREKRACPLHPEGGVTRADCPPKIVPKSKLSNAMIVDVLVRKYGDHLPAYRQSMILQRDAGIDLSRKTLISLIMKSGELLEALIPSLKSNLFEGHYIQADETQVPCQSPDVVGRNHRAFMWEFSRPQGPVLFEFQMGRERAIPKKFLEGFKGVLQSDAYAVYDKLGDGIAYSACWAHMRREFHRAHMLAKEDPRPLEIIGKIGKLYKLEDQARVAMITHKERQALREEKSRPLVKELKERILAIRCESDVLPAAQLGKACNYAMKQWTRLELFLGNGQIEIDNNWCENAIRPLAIGRKNWLHIGSEEAGPRVAAITSIFETCRRLNINVRDYLLDVLPQLPEWPMKKVAELSPLFWKPRQSSL